ncbi:hypothetical protein MACH17_18720 [Phaeobacter inhibens]|uniref:hypothetical protein n=1 Tax=Phaeobacter inhibens TaxID=221822 RepID=UPI0027759B2D|nr:hypothetical protein [Phaeobacter inhibens]GLO70355.1 hypothetical protein MACH17_18720 [Phaeobacter inhibens]
MNRRDFFVTTAAATSVPTALIIAGTSNPHRRLYERWKDLFSNSNSSQEDDLDALAVEMIAVEREICTAPAKSRDALLAQLEFARDAFGDFWCGNFGDGNDTRLLDNMIASISEM